MSDTESKTSLQGHEFPITVFPNLSGKVAEAWDITLPDLAQWCWDENRIRKNLLPLLKFGVFGSVRTDKKSLRHDANLKQISGVELDHDSGKMSFGEAVWRLTVAGIRCIVCTSPSHLVMGNDGVLREKWRVLAPSSQLLPPAARWQLVARLNGVLDGAAARESFTPISQTFYYGKVAKNPEHKVEVLDGDFIDLADDLDEGAIGEPVSEPSKKARSAAPKGDEASPARSDDDIEALIDSATDISDDGERQWHNNMLKVTASLVGKMLTDAEIHERCEPGYGDDRGYDDIQTMIDGAREKFGIPNPDNSDPELADLLGSVREEAQAAGFDVPPEEPQARTFKRKPRVQVRAGQLDITVDEAARHMIAGDVPFYQRGGMLVRPVILELKSFEGEPAFTAQLVEVSVHYMRDMMCRMIDWERFDKKANMWLPCNPPAEVALLLLSRFGDWPFRVLAGIITTQTMRPDGTLLLEPGYDAATQLLLINPPEMSTIPVSPSRADAERALGVLNELLEEFPFTIDDGGDGYGSMSRAVALSAIVSVVCRGAFPVVPMHAIDAPAAGTGKSYLLSAVSWIATGQPMAIIAAGKTAEETEKRLGAAVIAGQTMITIDNVEGRFGGDALCQLIEQVRPKVRILGQSTLVEVDGRSMSIFCNGNNLTLVGDIYRRVITCRLDAQVDRPEKRQFTKDPRAMILADRGKYIAACLTICRAYQVAGRPRRMPQIGSFNGWSDTVRSALVWLGEADSVETMDDTVGDDPNVIAHQGLMEEWHSVFGTRRVMLRDVVAKCNETVAGMGNDTGSGRFVYYDLRAAVQATDPEMHRRDVEVNMFGQKMRHFRDRWLGGMCFSKRVVDGETLWYLLVNKERTPLRTKPAKAQKNNSSTKSTS